MKKVIRSTTEEIFGMSKVLKTLALPEVKHYIDNFIYFSDSNSSHGPRIKFYGGTRETRSTQNSPSLAFDVNGNCQVELASWMNKKNCPNAFDDKIINNLETFVKTYKSILLLVWFGHLDEGYALEYFHGHRSFDQLLDDIEYDVPDEIETLDDLDRYCRSSNLYTF